MEATHTLESQVVGEIDRRAIEAAAAAVVGEIDRRAIEAAAAAGDPAPEPEHTPRRRRTSKPLPPASETEQITSDEGDPE